MNRSKIIGSTALATLMTAGAASAEMSLSGYISGKFQDNDGGGMTQSYSTNSIYVSYSDSLDNGMGLSVVMSISNGGANESGISIDTGMGTIGFGETQHSAVDGMDSNPACHSILMCYSVAISGKNGGTGLYDDGDTPSGNSIKYSNSMGGVSFAVSRGMEDTTYEPTMSYAASTSIMGASIAAGVSQIDRKGTGVDQDPSFVTVGYSIAGLNLGYAVYDSDTGGEETSMGVGTSVAGLDVGVQFADYDSAPTTTDTEYMRVSVNKGMGAASFGIDYLETDVAGGATLDTDVWNLNYVIGF
ncbi:porin [Pelagibacteraceae bacterium]|nr:porin [Pelagibacteraceae bacterium]